MHRQLLLSLLRRHQPIDASERAMTQATIAFVEQHPDCFNRSLTSGHVTGSAWIRERNPASAAQPRILLIHHRKLDRWFQPGGHADGDPDVAAVALREAQEETGLQSVQFVQNSANGPSVFDVDVHRIPARNDVPEHLHYDIRFLLDADANEPIGMSEEVSECAWFSIEQAWLITQEESIGRMIRKTS